MIIVVGNQKGGVGKSTLAVNISATLAQHGHDVMLVDADRQTSSSEWWIERKNNFPESPKIHCVNKYGDIDDSLLDLSKRYGFVIVDVAGRDSDELRSSLEVCDALLMPFRPSSTDTNTLPTMSRIAKNAKRTNPKLQAFACLSIAPTNAKLKEIGFARDTIMGYPDVILLNTTIFDRVCYRDGMALGLGVTEMDGKSDSEVASRREMMELVKEIMHDVI